MEPGVSEAPPKPEPSAEVSSKLETASKFAAAFAVILYGCGLLITSISYSRYGFLDMNPLRPRPVLAGAWFASFCAASYAVLEGTSGLKAELKKRPVSILTWLGVAISYCIGFGALTSLTSFLFEIPPGTLTIFGVRFYVAAAILFVLSYLAETKKIPWLFATVPASAALLWFLWLLIQQAILPNTFSDGLIFIWFSAGCLGITFVVKILSSPRVDSWPLAVFVALGGLLAFARYYYPNIKASWGGGAPIAVTIYPAKTATISAEKISGLLIEDSDAGLYIVNKGDNRATFLPRSSIGLIHFADDISKSPSPPSKPN